MTYLGEWGGVSVYQPEYKQVQDVYGLMQPSVLICTAKCTRWFRIVLEDYRDGLCNECWLEQFEGEEEL